MIIALQSAVSFTSNLFDCKTRKFGESWEAGSGYSEKVVTSHTDGIRIHLSVTASSGFDFNCSYIIKLVRVPVNEVLCRL